MAPPRRSSAAPPRPAALETPIELAPFVVSSTSEKAYLATQTLTGTRLKTDLKDLGSALTLFTAQMMADLAATNINELLLFAPNTDPFASRLGEGAGPGNDFINIGTQRVTRGGTTSVVGQDFFGNGVPNDRYNSEARFRSYYDPAAGRVGNSGLQFARFPVLFADSPLPPRDESGLAQW